MKYLRVLLLPLSLLYGLVVAVRNWLYDTGFYKSKEFKFPVISVGNLEVGGAGKTPMTEYLIRLFKDDLRVATLSRGYGRVTTGYLTAATNTNATTVGDEPAQFKHKFPEVRVAVSEDRVYGIERLRPTVDVIIMDDAYQHRAVKPGFSILLFDYNKLRSPHFMLPAGDLREPFSGRWRADILIATKCPSDLSEQAQSELTDRLRPLSYQQVFFTGIQYLPLQELSGKVADVAIDAETEVFLLTGIANPKPLLQHLQKQSTLINHYNYPDHHQFTLKNISKLADAFTACKTQKKCIITTEKDAQRLGGQDLQPLVAQLPILVMPIGINFLNDGQPEFDRLVTNYVREYTANYAIY